MECGNTGPQSPQCSPGVPSTDGPGVRNTDFILYVSANQQAAPCAGGQTLAFAAACQTESELDRPIAGYVNFCPNNLAGATRDYLFDVTKHEIFHALGFSYSLMPLWRNSSGARRTPESVTINTHTHTHTPSFSVGLPIMDILGIIYFVLYGEAVSPNNATVGFSPILLIWYTVALHIMKTLNKGRSRKTSL